MWTAALGVATLVAGVVGLGIWRAAFAARARGTSLAALWRVGAALAAGFLLGEWLSLENIGAGGSGVLVDAVFGTGGPRPLPPIVSTAVFGLGDRLGPSPSSPASCCTRAGSAPAPSSGWPARARA